MFTTITLVVALCSGSKFDAVKQKMADLQTKNPGTTITLKLDKKAVCSNGQIMSGKDAKLFAALQAGK